MFGFGLPKKIQSAPKLTPFERQALDILGRIERELQEINSRIRDWVASANQS